MAHRLKRMFAWLAVLVLTVTCIPSGSIKTVYAAGANKTGQNNQESANKTGKSSQEQESQLSLDMECDRNVLPGWEGTIQHWYYVHPEDNENSDDSFDARYEVIDARIIASECYEADKEVLSEFEKQTDKKDPDKYWWWYKADGIGRAEIEVTYKDPDEKTKTYTFEIFVCEDVYELKVDTRDGSDTGFPGSKKTLAAQLEHYTREGIEPDDEVIYKWSIVKGTEHAQITPVADDPSRAEVTFRDLEEGEQEVKEEIRVELIAYEGTDSRTGAPIERGRHDISLHMADTFEEILPTRIKGDQAVGGTEMVAMEVHRFSAENESGYDLIPDVFFRWYYDSNVVEITDSSGNVVGNKDAKGQYIDTEVSHGAVCYFTIRRLEDWDTDIHLDACWTDEEGNRHNESLTYYMNRNSQKETKENSSLQEAESQSKEESGKDSRVTSKRNKAQE